MSENVLYAAIMALVSLPLSIALAASGLPLTSAMLLFNPPKRVKVFRDKYGQQTATLCLLAGIVSILGLGCGAAVMWTQFPAAASFWLAWPLPAAPLAAVLVIGAVLAIIYRATWQTLKEKRAAQASIGVFATVSAWVLGYLFLSFFRHFAAIPADPSADPFLFLPPAASSAWLLLPWVLALSLAMAGALSPLYLIYRRDKDDFGRDYYSYALKMAAKWATFATLAALACQAGLFAILWPSVRDLPIRPSFFWGGGIGLVCFVMACLLWGLVLKSQNPLRLKLHCVTAFFLTVAGLAGVLASYAKFFLG